LRYGAAPATALDGSDLKEFSMIRGIAACALALGLCVSSAAFARDSSRIVCSGIAEYGATGNLDKIGVSMDFLERRAGSGGNREIILSSIYQGKLFQGSMINTSDEFQGRIVMKNGASQFYAGGFKLMPGQDGKYTMILDGKINDDPSGGNTLAPIKARLSCVDLSI
jgi:hypothetical protein